MKVLGTNRESKMKDKIDIRLALKQGILFSKSDFEKRQFRLSGCKLGADSDNLPMCRDDAWQAMLRMVLGYVPKGAEHAPPCNCELRPIAETYNFGGLAGLPQSVRLMDGFFPVRDQSKRGACFAFALVALCEYMLGKTVELSEQSLFHFTKLVTPGKVEDLGDGAIIPDSIRAVEEYGICPLSEWHYNPESWNYVEDPYNEGQGKALQRKLAAAQPYRFQNWRNLSRGSVLHFKQALSAGFPIYTGMLVTTDWETDEVRKTGVIPMSKLLWKIKIAFPSRGYVESIIAENGVDPDSDEAEALVMQVVGELVSATVKYLMSAVFGCEFIVYDIKESTEGVEIVVLLDKIRGGHALCLAGYVDNPSYAGGGYFIARNSWSEDKWAPNSPEMPGYALIPYAYIADLCQEGVVMSNFPKVEGVPNNLNMSNPAGGISLKVNGVEAGGASSIGAAGLSGFGMLKTQPGNNSQSCVTSAATSGIPSAIGASGSSQDEFEAWLAERTFALDKIGRDLSGVLLRVIGTPIFVPDLSERSKFLKVTNENRDKMRKTFEALKKERMDGERRELESRLETLVRDVVFDLFKADAYAVVTMPELKKEILTRASELSAIGDLDCKIRSAIIALQEKFPEKIWFGYGFGGAEEIRPSGNSNRIKK